MPREHRAIAGLLLAIGCRGPQSATAPPQASVKPDPTGFAVTLALPSPSYIAIYELNPGRPLERISPVALEPVDTLILPKPVTASQPGRSALEPHLAVTSPSGAELPLGEAEAWRTARVTWTRPSLPGRRIGSEDRPLWFILWLSRPVTPAMDSVAAALELACCTNASGLAAQVGTAFGLASEQVRVVAPR